uniref:Uncharacterized protein n=1 Tax=Oryza meridionalis TaxID=40149 RepID=A0A0E0FAH1_9ORYZ
MRKHHSRECLPSPSPPGWAAAPLWWAESENGLADSTDEPSRYEIQSLKLIITNQEFPPTPAA